MLAIVRMLFSCCNVATDDPIVAESKPRQLKLTDGKRWRTSRVIETARNSRRWSRRPASSIFNDEKRFTGFDFFSILATCPDEHPAPERLSSCLRPLSPEPHFDLTGKPFSSMCLDAGKTSSTKDLERKNRLYPNLGNEAIFDEKYEYPNLPPLEPDLPPSLSVGVSHGNGNLEFQYSANRRLSIVYENPPAKSRSRRQSRRSQTVHFEDLEPSSGKTAQRKQKEFEKSAGDVKFINLSKRRNR